MASEPWQDVGVNFALAVWHLSNGGLNTTEIAKALGTTLHSSRIEAVIEGMRHTVQGPITMKEPVRCGECGAALTEIPCSYCGGPIIVHPRYRDMTLRRKYTDDQV